MKRFLVTVCAVAVVTLLSGCAVPGSYFGGGYYASTATYNASCDYYTPPWGYPSDYCRYQIWSDPVYSGGIWYGGPIYFRTYGGTNWFWLNNGWRRNEWRGARPRIDWSRGGNRYWSGNIVRRGGNGANSLAVPARRGGARVGRPAARNNGGGRAIRNNDGANSLALPGRRGGARVGGPAARNNGGGRAIRNNDGANSLAVPARRGGARLGGPAARNNSGGRAIRNNDGANSIAVPARRGGARVGRPAARNNGGGRAIRNNGGANSLALPARRGGGR